MFISIPPCEVTYVYRIKYGNSRNFVLVWSRVLSLHVHWKLKPTIYENEFINFNFLFCQKSAYNPKIFKS